TSSFTAGVQTLNISYSGDADFAASTASASVTVSAVPADFTLASGGNGTQTVVLNVQSTVLTARQDAVPLRLPALALGMLLLPLAGARRLRRSARRMKGYGLTLLLVLAGVAL